MGARDMRRVGMGAAGIPIPAPSPDNRHASRPKGSTARTRSRHQPGTFSANIISGDFGWGGRIRTYGTRYQKPMPYHLATPQLWRRIYPSCLAGARAKPAFFSQLCHLARCCGAHGPRPPQTLCERPRRPPGSPRKIRIARPISPFGNGLARRSGRTFPCRFGISSPRGRSPEPVYLVRSANVVLTTG